MPDQNVGSPEKSYLFDDKHFRSLFSEGYRRYLALCLTESVSQLVSQLVSVFLFFKTHIRVLLVPGPSLHNLSCACF